MRRPMAKGGWLTTALLVAAAAAGAEGCSLLGKSGDEASEPAGGGAGKGGQSGTGAGGGKTDPTQTLPASCPGDTPKGMKVEAIASGFASDVYPLLAKTTEGGCVSCHGASSPRSFKVTGNATETFYKAQAAGLLDNSPSGILARLRSQDDATRMPREAKAWAAADVARVEKVVCELAAMGGIGGDAADEQFPPGLLGAYTGAPNGDYDNTFLVYPQLRSKVKAVFGDDWVRDGVDKFAENVELFGGADFKQTFVEKQAASPDFLLGLDSLAKDVCGQAASQGTGPFAGIDTKAPLTDLPASTTVQLEAENDAQLKPTVGGKTQEGWMLWTNGSLDSASSVPFPAGATYRITVRALGSLADGVGPTMEVRVDGAPIKTFENLPASWADYAVEAPVEAGAKTVSVAFTNDKIDAAGNDRNLTVDWVKIEGPLGGGGGTKAADAAKASVDTLYRRMLFRPATDAEKTDGLALLVDLLPLAQNQADAWSGLCEGLLRHPDFLFTLPPSRAATKVDADRKALLLVKLAQDLTGAPPKQADLDAVRKGDKSVEQMVDQYLASTEFRDWFFGRMRLRTESDGTAEADEPARLWTYLATHGEPFQGLLVGEFSVDESYAKASRPAYHGKTGLLTMKGFIKHKQGLPHYNYAARVMTDFMGSVFQVPPEVLAQRALATAATTVDPTSLCFSCHKILTPLAYQRLKWADDGTYREKDDKGADIDDSDHNLVADYPYKGKGLESFSTKAVKKEAFLRHTLDAAYLLLMRRPMRAEQDERTTYKSLWDVASASNGDLRRVIKAIVLSPAYQGP